MSAITVAYNDRGMTLIELMIAMTIGLIILLGLSSVFVAGKSSYNVQEKFGDLQENGRFALMFLQRDIRMAGYPKNSFGASAFIPAPAGGCSTTNTTAAPTTTCNDIPIQNGSSADTSDSIGVSFLAPTGGITDCLGNSIAANTVISEIYFIALNTTTSVRSLMCTSVGNGTQSLVEGIEKMQIQYGVDNDTDQTVEGYGYADYYATADGVTAANKWDRVVAVRLAVLSSTIEPISDEASSDQSFVLLDQPTTYSNTKIRGRVFTTTIEVRNRTPGT